ncbi:hypothetical protein D9619_010619 [Psilocybe cf. subviscida]|uniref:Uncharacterized protein n=1 Tax=Psilocybe cf. subviscida TaxID=2480587 RepID=A0A8H5EZT5_9AGAR|nr:hypothetical protein D9619_010619 [Psilocybe cf. subviscida]
MVPRHTTHPPHPPTLTFIHHIPTLTLILPIPSSLSSLSSTFSVTPPRRSQHRRILNAPGPSRQAPPLMLPSLAIV